MSENNIVERIKFGRVNGTIFRNSGPTGEWHNIQIGRRYQKKDDNKEDEKEGEWHTSTSYSLFDLPDLAAVQQLGLIKLAELDGVEPKSKPIDPEEDEIPH